MKYPVIYDRLSLQIDIEKAPSEVEGDTPKKALENSYKHKFHRVYGEALKSPDVIIMTPSGRMGFVASKKSPKYNAILEAEQKSNGKRRIYDERRHKWLFSRK